MMSLAGHIGLGSEKPKASFLIGKAQREWHLAFGAKPEESVEHGTGRFQCGSTLLIDPFGPLSAAGEGLLDNEETDRVMRLT